MSKLLGTKKFVVRDYDHLEDLSDYEMNSKKCVLAYCKQCSGWSMTEMRLCNQKDCPLCRLKNYYLKQDFS